MFQLASQRPADTTNIQAVIPSHKYYLRLTYLSYRLGYRFITTTGRLSKKNIEDRLHAAVYPDYHLIDLDLEIKIIKIIFCFDQITNIFGLPILLFVSQTPTRAFLLDGWAFSPYWPTNKKVQNWRGPVVCFSSGFISFKWKTDRPASKKEPGVYDRFWPLTGLKGLFQLGGTDPALIKEPAFI